MEEWIGQQGDDSPCRDTSFLDSRRTELPGLYSSQLGQQHEAMMIRKVASLPGTRMTPEEGAVGMLMRTDMRTDMVLSFPPTNKKLQHTKNASFARGFQKGFNEGGGLQTMLPDHPHTMINSPCPLLLSFES